MTTAVKDARSAVNKVIDWLRWFVWVVLWVILALIVAKAIPPLAPFLPDIGTAALWVYPAGMYWLLK